MKEKGKKLSAVLLAGILFATLLTGCSSPERTGLSGASNTGRATQAAAEQPAGSPSDQAGGKSVGEFSTQDVNGNPYTKEMFRDHDISEYLYHMVYSLRGRNAGFGETISTSERQRGKCGRCRSGCCE